MSRQTPHPPLVAACAVELNGAANRIQLFPAGEFRGNDGRPADAPCWRMTAELAAPIVAALNNRAVRLMVDYEHQTLYAASNGQPNPASGWLGKLEWVEGKGLFAEVEWTAAAKKRIAEGEYRYISPMFHYLPSGDITTLLPPALTNTPALDELDPVALAAASKLFVTPATNPPKEDPMNEALKQMLALLNLPETATEAEQLAAVEQLKAATGGKPLAELLADKAADKAADKKDGDKGEGQADPAPPAAPPADPGTAPNTAAASAQTVPLDVLKGLQQQVAALSQQLAQQEADKTTALITAALSDGRLLPAQKAWAENLGKTHPQALADFLATAQPLAALSSMQSGGIPTAAGKAGLSAEEAAVAAALNISPDDYAKAKEANA
ncbi:phage protease [Neisseria shayeganii]|uniref:Phage protease n=1 Tax=Neisseria shayeganii TaxID=607712 RepID=A0A7D7S7I1_9NEIS|nr:phage protease [Neisseria shayeganii]QMT39991.1 phage protease [Neisseria shayeganii]